MKRTYLLSMIAVGIAVAAAALGTYAYFSSAAAPIGTTVTNGNFVITTAIFDAAGDPQAGISASNLAPNIWQTAGYLVIYNSPTSADSALLKVFAQDFSAPSPFNPDDANIRLTLNPSDFSDSAAAVTNGGEYTYTNFGMTPDSVIYSDDLTSFANFPLMLSASPINIPGLPKGQFGVIKIEMQLNPNAGNGEEGGSATFSLVGCGTQATGGSFSNAMACP